MDSLASIDTTLLQKPSCKAPWRARDDTLEGKRRWGRQRQFFRQNTTMDTSRPTDPAMHSRGQTTLARTVYEGLCINILSSQSRDEGKGRLIFPCGKKFITRSHNSKPKCCIFTSQTYWMKMSHVVLSDYYIYGIKEKIVSTFWKCIH